MKVCTMCGAQIADSASVCPQCGAAQQPVQTQNTVVVSDKNKITFGLLAIFLGALGIQYFYINKPIPGIVFLILTFVTCGFTGLFSLIQGIVVLTGTDENFQAKFLNPNNSFPLI